MPNIVTAGFCTDISSAGFCLTVEALCLPPAQGLSFQPSPVISRAGRPQCSSARGFLLQSFTVLILFLMASLIL